MTTALLDTCVLVPSRARDVLLEIASADVYRPLWSTEILAELDRTLLAKRGASTEEIDAYLTRLFRSCSTSSTFTLAKPSPPSAPSPEEPGSPARE
jgi:hypothetical protein